ncbi:MAG TPA: Pls/PosA family non-ribosomal peptide synthetase, partial [Kineosporiaceae bacterium]|nr:Pls/PosA family non-ribosomal peptide synthetase [Kineosporiaceae bacterium]
VVLDPETGQLLPPESTGELGIAGIGLAVGYVNRPDLTAKAFVPDPIGLSDNPSGRIYRTGDLVRTRRDGEIEYLGRIDLQVKIRGYRIELTEIESVLMRAPGVAQAVVTTHSAQPDLVELAAFVSRRRDVARLDLDEVLGFLRERLPPYMVPAYLEELAAIPLLPSDKADRKALPVPRRRAGASSGGVAARTDTEATLAALVGETLGLPEVGVDRHLFDDLGGNSLLMAQFSARVRRDPRLPALSMRDIYLNPTIERLAARADALQAATPSQPPVTMPGGLPALPTAEQPDAGSRRPRHSRLAYAATGIAQLAVMLLGLWAAAAMTVKAYVFVSGAPTLLSAYQRAVLATVLLTALMSAGPIAAKWILVGRWKAQEIPLWSLAHLRFWLAARLQVLSPLAARVGSPLQVLHLRALGARIGPGVVLLTRGPVCTDMVSIGAGTIVRQGALLSTYRPENGRLRTGSITLGQDVVVGEQCILDIDTAMAAGSRLLHASSLQRGQAVPAGEVWHGSPGQPMDGPAPPMPVQPFSAARRIVYPTLQLLWTLLFWGPLAFAAIKLPLTRFALDGGSTAWLHLNPQSAADLVSAPFASQLLIAAAAIYGLVIAIGLLAVLTVPRVLNLGLRPETDHPVLGWRFALARAVTRSTNVKFHMQLFGDSSYILGYLRALGWRVDRAEQSGSNFGVSQRHETPYLVSVGRGTMVSDGLAVLNSEYSATAFRLRQVDIGATCFFGNNVAYPADARTGDNCLFGTKVAVPVNGPVRHGTGLLGSPAFEIPRSVARDAAAFPELRRPAVRAQRLRRKNRHNLRTMSAFLALGWFRLAVALYSAFAASVLPVGDSTRVAVAGVLASVSGLVVSVLVERTVLLFRPLKPRFCSVYDPAFWRHERYWKLSLSGPLAVLAGTPMRPLLLRALGAKVGKGVFDDGCGMPERSLVTIGDWTCLAAGTTVQAHSLEDGTFKSDHIVIGSHVTLGVGAFVHYGTVVGDGALIEADSFLMKGEEVPPGDRWAGNPAQPAPAQLKDADGVGTSVDARRVDLGPAASTSLPSRAGRALEALGVAASMPFESGGVRLAVLDLNRGDRDVAALPLDILDAADHAEMLLITDWARRDADGAGRVLARLCLSAWWYPEIEPSAWCFARTPTGRLDVVGPVPGLHLSVSHAGQVVAVATSDRGPVGVDVETEPDTVAALSGASAALTDGEQARLRAAPPDGSGPLFLQMWTLKEATAKALGRATVIDLRSIETSLSPPAALVTADSLGDGTQPAPSAFRQLQLTVGSRTYWLSVAVTEPMSRGIPATRQLAHGHADAVGTRARPIRHRRVPAPGAASRIDRRRQAGIVKLIKVIYVLVGLTVTWQRGYLTPTVVKTLLSAALHVMLWFLLLLGIDPHVP